jgi:hypothetical protein
MSFAIEEGYAPGCIGRVVQLHADYYARSSGFGVRFEAKVAQELARFCSAFFRLMHQSPGSTWGTAVQEQRFVRECP